MFPDYHGLDDEWEKIDYANMARIDRMAALGLVLIADGPAPAWNKDNRNAAAFQKKKAARMTAGRRGGRPDRIASGRPRFRA